MMTQQLAQMRLQAMMEQLDSQARAKHDGDVAAQEQLQAQQEQARQAAIERQQQHQDLQRALVASDYALPTESPTPPVVTPDQFMPGGVYDLLHAPGVGTNVASTGPTTATIAGNASQPFQGPVQPGMPTGAGGYYDIFNPNWAGRNGSSNPHAPSGPMPNTNIGSPTLPTFTKPVTTTPTVTIPGGNGQPFQGPIQGTGSNATNTVTTPANTITGSGNPYNLPNQALIPTATLPGASTVTTPTVGTGSLTGSGDPFDMKALMEALAKQRAAATPLQNSGGNYNPGASFQGNSPSNSASFMNTGSTGIGSQIRGLS